MKYASAILDLEDPGIASVGASAITPLHQSEMIKRLPLILSVLVNNMMHTPSGKKNQTYY